MPHCDVTAGHYYDQLMTNAHSSCRWPAAAWFTEHGQQGIVAGYRLASRPTDYSHTVL